MRRLTDLKRREITENVRGLMIRRLRDGVSDSSRTLCHSCGYTKPAVGTLHYSRYRLCNDCALKYELSKAEGKVENVEDFVVPE
jgi:hypothetical protein